ncbi:MAG TPA: hypothetical protein VHE30_30140 [Polyangiaceae bacterium]|nr:hypothetical protein [Polyangiaceae bacterium]
MRGREPSGTSDAAIYALFALVGLAIVAPTVFGHGRWGAGATSGGILLVVAFRGLLTLLWDNVARHR